MADGREGVIRAGENAIAATDAVSDAVVALRDRNGRADCQHGASA